MSIEGKNPHTSTHTRSSVQDKFKGEFFRLFQSSPPRSFPSPMTQPNSNKTELQTHELVDIIDARSPFVVKEDEYVDHNAAVALAYEVRPALSRAIRETQSLMPTGSQTQVVMDYIDSWSWPVCYSDVVRPDTDPKRMRWIPQVSLNDAFVKKLSPEAQTFVLTHRLAQTAFRFERLGAIGEPLEIFAGVGQLAILGNATWHSSKWIWRKTTNLVGVSQAPSVVPWHSTSTTHAPIRTCSQPQAQPQSLVFAQTLIHSPRAPPPPPLISIPTLPTVWRIFKTRLLVPVWCAAYAVIAAANYTTDMDAREFAIQHGHRAGAIAYTHATMDSFDRAAYRHPHTVGRVHRAVCMTLGYESIPANWLAKWEAEEATVSKQ
jgi:hypothetical protein